MKRLFKSHWAKLVIPNWSVCRLDISPVPGHLFPSAIKLVLEVSILLICDREPFVNNNPVQWPVDAVRYCWRSNVHPVTMGVSSLDVSTQVNLDLLFFVHLSINNLLDQRVRDGAYFVMYGDGDFIVSWLWFNEHMEYLNSLRGTWSSRGNRVKFYYLSKWITC